jgi:hypothetical protein
LESINENFFIIWILPILPDLIHSFAVFVNIVSRTIFSWWLESEHVKNDECSKTKAAVAATNTFYYIAKSFTLASGSNNKNWASYPLGNKESKIDLENNCESVLNINNFIGCAALATIVVVLVVTSWAFCIICIFGSPKEITSSNG